MPPERNNGTSKISDATRESNGSNSETYKRAYKACVACREKKVKCDLGSVDQPSEPPCRRCKRESRPCIMGESKRGRPRRNMSSRSTSRPAILEGGFESTSTTEHFNLNDDDHTDDNYQLQIGVLSHKNSSSSSKSASAPIPPPHSRASLPYESNHHQTSTSPVSMNNANHTSPSQSNGSYSNNNNSSSNSSNNNNSINNTITNALNSKGSILAGYDERNPKGTLEGTSNNTFTSLERVDIHNQSDALKVLAGVASHDILEGRDRNTQSSNVHPHPSDTPGSSNSGVKKNWSSSKLVQNKIVTKREAIELTTLFLDSLYPFGPQLCSIPRCLEPEHLLVGKDEVLLGAILSVASRYYRPKGVGGSVRAEIIHGSVWNWTQKYISKALWNEKYRSIAVIEALLVLAEWATKGIHFDDSDCTMDSDDEDQNTETNNNNNNETGVDEEGEANNVSSLFVASRRFDGLAYMLLGHAVRMCHQLGLHGEDVYTMKNMKRIGFDDYSRQLQTYLYTLDADCYLSIRLGNEFASPRISPPFIIGVKDQFDEAIKSEGLGEDVDLKWALTFAKVELFMLLRSVHDLLDKFRLHIDEIACERIMRLVNTELVSWAAKYKSVFHASPPSQAFRIALEYHHVRLYAYGTIAEARLRARRAKSGPGPLPLLYSHSFYYLIESVTSAQKIIDISTKFREITTSSSLTYAPASFFLLVVYASLFLIKVATAGRSTLPLEECVQWLQKASDHLILSSFDDLHLSKRYGELLKHICSQLEQISANNPNHNQPQPQHHTHTHTQQEQQQSMSSSNFYDNVLPNLDHGNSTGTAETLEQNTTTANTDIWSQEQNKEQSQSLNFIDILGIDVSSPVNFNIPGLSTDSFTIENGLNIGNNYNQAETYFDENALFNLNEHIDAPFLSSSWFDNFVDSIQTNLGDN